MFLAIKIEIDFLVFTTSHRYLGSKGRFRFRSLFLHRIVDFRFHLFLSTYPPLATNRPVLHSFYVFGFLNDWFFQLNDNFYSHKPHNAILCLTCNSIFSFLFLLWTIYFLPSIYMLYSFVFKYSVSILTAPKSFCIFEILETKNSF